jgi:hypothetical protein
MSIILLFPKRPNPRWRCGATLTSTQHLYLWTACLNEENAAPASSACTGRHMGHQCHTHDGCTLTANTTYVYKH